MKFILMSCGNVISQIDDPDMVVLPCQGGDCGIMKDHMPMISVLDMGIISVYKKDKIISKFCVSEGVSSIYDNKLEVICREIVDMNDVNITDIKDRLKLAKSDKNENDIMFCEYVIPLCK